MLPFARAALWSGDWCREIVPVWGTWSLVEGLVLAGAGVKWWRRDWQDAVMLTSLGGREEIGDEVRHAGLRGDVLVRMLLNVGEPSQVTRRYNE